MTVRRPQKSEHGDAAEAPGQAYKNDIGSTAPTKNTITSERKKVKHMNKLQLIDADTLYYKPLAHPKMLIDGVLSDGLAILAGDSKIGKSWMVLWLCLQISRGKAVWGLPTRKTDVVYLALEDREWRVQQRMQELTDSPPENLRFGFSCGQLGAELEGQIEEALREFPSTGLIFIDTLQMVRDNASAKVNAYAQDYKDLSGLKKLADDHGICIFVVHHTRKERDSSNIFNDMTGSTGILGVADTGMILRKDDRFGDCATLCITGRDVEEKKLKNADAGRPMGDYRGAQRQGFAKGTHPGLCFSGGGFSLDARAISGHGVPAACRRR